ncbi:hypothetical protein SAMN02745121_02373 [Nannocystis exedens]|uniref:ADYC domain-containing protein n=1 Tax=Nannocystis exedens TaxID=54 RepID=A0A1I1WID0_9BACT|nr:ADYC domain-containing protein [Nannocystis exedens]PCC67737.1 hypothetical protein NAEX_00745 [Nannocystis exedens]SFD94731.1 hypothetical protein SAMN02745121_02373 [Nannocystis exedens]
MMLRRLSLAGVLALSVTTSLFVGCDPPANHDGPADAAGDDDLLFRTTYGSGSGANPPVYGNTSALGEHAFNELDLTHAPHDGHVFQHVHLWDRARSAYAPDPLDAVWVDGAGEIHGSLGATQYSGGDFIRSRWTIDVLTPTGTLTRELYIHAHQYHPTEDYHGYTFSFPDDPAYGAHAVDPGRVRDLGATAGACTVAEDGSIEAIVLAGHHVDPVTSVVSARSDTMLIACLSGAMGKALKWGYRPQALGASAYQAAIRMVRADYCGDGVSWTEPGQAIDIKDEWPVHDWSNPAQFTETEAIWGPNGALCLGTPRLQDEFDYADITCPGGARPACSPGDTLATYQPAAMIWTRIRPN